MKLTDISNNKAKEIIEGAPKEATHFSCIEGKTQYYKNETVISSLDEVFINVFRDIFQPSVFLLSDLENKMNIDKVETQTEHQEEMSAFSGENLPKPSWAKWSVGDSVEKTKGSSWTGKVVGYYSTSLTPNGYAVESLTEKGSVQIYPEAALCDTETKQQREDRERLEAAYELYLIRCHAVDHPITYEFHEFKSEPDAKDGWLAVVDKTNYRKGVK